MPANTFDPGEITFSGRSDDPGADNSIAAQQARVALQQTAFEQFIERNACLERQRGRLMERNSCREPWFNTTVAALRQSLPVGDGAFEAQVDIYNVLNLLNRRWGRRRIAQPELLEHVAHTGNTAGTGQPIFRFNTAREDWTPVHAETAFQLQIGLRYRF